MEVEAVDPGPSHSVKRSLDTRSDTNCELDGSAKKGRLKRTVKIGDD